MPHICGTGEIRNAGERRLFVAVGRSEQSTRYSVIGRQTFSQWERSMIPLVMSHLATQLGYSAGEFQALQLIVLAAFGVVD